MGKFLKIAGIVIVVGIGVMQMYRNWAADSEIRQSSFSGTVTEMREERERVYRRRGRSSEEVMVVMVIKAEDGGVVEWRAPESFARYYQTGDFFVKLPGKEVPAVFRGGEQLGVSGAPYYLKDRLNLADYKKPNP